VEKSKVNNGKMIFIDKSIMLW